MNVVNAPFGAMGISEVQDYLRSHAQKCREAAELVRAIHPESYKTLIAQAEKLESWANNWTQALRGYLRENAA